MYTTPVSIPVSPVQISYQDTVLTLGSCFSEHIGKRLQQSLFHVDMNPFGVLYNPLSIKNSLLKLLADDYFTEKDLCFSQSLWHSFAHSSAFSDLTPEGCLQRVNRRLQASRQMLDDIRFILITFGTARVYRYEQTGRIVSNCHKLPAKEFSHYRLSVNDIVDEYRSLLNTLKCRLPQAEIIFTVSPIRHWKDGAHENNLSKATLLLAIDALQREFDHTHYFPAYELLMDELRDYRYYAEDMLHPSATAINYIWERFSDCYFSTETREQQKEIDRFMTDLGHRPLHPESEAFKQFTSYIRTKEEQLERKYPFMRERLEAYRNGENDTCHLHS